MLHVAQELEEEVRLDEDEETVLEEEERDEEAVKEEDVVRALECR